MSIKIESSSKVNHHCNQPRLFRVLILSSCLRTSSKVLSRLLMPIKRAFSTFSDLETVLFQHFPYDDGALLKISTPKLPSSFDKKKVMRRAA